MVIKSRGRLITFITALVFMFCLVGGPVLAVKPDSVPVVVHSQTDDLQMPAAATLSETKLKVCKKRETKINSIMERIASRGERQIEVFNNIATKTQDFYTNKHLSLSNYDALVADVNAKKEAAQTAVDTVKSSSVTFKCDGTDPKGAAQVFQGKLKDEIAALKTYKTSVKNLIVGVKSVAGDSSASESSGDSQ